MRSMFPFVLLLAACPAPEKPATDTPDAATPAKFADATPKQRAEALQVAVGFGGVYATLAQFQADADARSVDEDNVPSGCPALEELAAEPLTVAYTATSCTGPSGLTWDGALHAVNPFRWEDTEQREGAMELTFDGFSLRQGLMTQSFDGTFAQTDIREGEDAVATFDLTVKLGTSVWRHTGGSDLTWTDGVQRTVCHADTTGAVEKLGAFDIACDLVSFGTAEASGFVELVGEDTLRVDMTPDEDNCFPATVDGQPVAPICFEGAGEEPEPALDDTVFFGSGTGCMEDELFIVDAETVVGEVARMEIAAVRAGTTDIERHVLPMADSSDDDWDVWMIQAGIGEYVPGVSTALTCEDQATMHLVFFAYDENDALVGCQDGSMTRDLGPIDVSACPRL